MSAGVPVIGSSATLGELRELLATGRAGRLVVVAGGPFRNEPELPAGGALGVVTRGDLLRALHETGECSSGRLPTRTHRGRTGAGSGRSSAFATSCPRSRRWRLPSTASIWSGGGARRAARRAEPRPRPDGGGRRDRVRAACWPGAGRVRPPARAVRDRGRSGPHGGGAEVRVDIASARTEFYGAPGALPEVERSTLRHDLARRDFTINAMATSLKADDFGATYDFFGGFRDLAGPHGPGAAQPQLRGGPDPAPAGDPLRGAAGLSHGRPHAVAGARVHRHEAGRRPRVRAPARRGAGPARRAAGPASGGADGRDRSRPRPASAPRCRPAGDRADRARGRGDAQRAVRERGPAGTGPPRVHVCVDAPHEVYDWLGRIRMRRREQDVVASLSSWDRWSPSDWQPTGQCALRSSTTCWRAGRWRCSSSRSRDLPIADRAQRATGRLRGAVRGAELDISGDD